MKDRLNKLVAQKKQKTEAAAGKMFKNATVITSTLLNQQLNQQQKQIKNTAESETRTGIHSYEHSRLSQLTMIGTEIPDKGHSVLFVIVSNEDLIQLLR